MDPAGLAWRKASKSSSGGGACVEIGTDPDTAAVRDTKDREGGTLVFSPSQFGEFVAAVKYGAFDLS